MAPDAAPRDEDLKAKQAADGPAAADQAAAVGTEGETPSEADAIRRIQALGSDWEQPAISGRLVDEVLRRIRDEGILSAQTIYNTNIYDAEIKGSLTVGKPRARTEPSMPAHQVGEEALLLVKDIFASPDGVAGAVSVFQSRRMVVLRGAPGSGRHTTALWLAANAAVGRVFYLHSDRLLAAMHGGQLEDNAVYIVPGLDRDTAARLDDFVLGEVDGWLSRGSGLVITVDYSVALHPDLASRSEILVEVVGCPSSVDVAKNHARKELARTVAARTTAEAGVAAPAHEPPELTARLLGWFEDSEILARLQARPEPRFAAQAGRALALAAWNDDDPHATIVVLENPQEHAEHWFGQHTDTAERSLIVAVSVLDGASYLAVTDAAAALRRELTGFRSPRNDCPSFWPLVVDEPWLEVTEVRRPSPLGSVPVEVVGFRNGRTQTAVLEYAWRRLDGMRRAMSAWLMTLGGANDAEISARAAAAAGIVSLFDFRYALDNIVLSWAHSKTPDLRETAALALSFPAGDSRYTDPVWRLLGSWYDPESASPELTQTAICALGGPLGAQAPEAALAALRAIVDTWGWEYAFDVARSLVLLTASGHATAVLSALRDWSERKTPAQRDKGESVVIGLSCFLLCAMPLTTDTDGVTRPLILGPGNDGLGRVALLWSRAFDSSSVRAWALELLRGWFGLRDVGDGTAEYVLELVLQIAELDKRQRQRLEHHCYKWANDTTNPSMTAKEALALLREPETGWTENL